MKQASVEAQILALWGAFVGVQFTTAEVIAAMAHLTATPAGRDAGART